MPGLVRIKHLFYVNPMTGKQGQLIIEVSYL